MLTGVGATVRRLCHHHRCLYGSGANHTLDPSNRRAGEMFLSHSQPPEVPTIRTTVTAVAEPMVVEAASQVPTHEITRY